MTTWSPSIRVAVPLAPVAVTVTSYEPSADGAVQRTAGPLATSKLPPVAVQA